MLTVEEARARILSVLSPVSAETIDLLSATGRPCAEAVRAVRSLPSFDNSAMDGYALRGADTAGATAFAPVTLRVTEVIAAGTVAAGEVKPGECMRIFTGAPMPAGTDAVVMQEDTRTEGDRVRVLSEAKTGKHVRRAGEDVEVGQVLIAAGGTIRSGEVGMLAAQGRSWVRVVRRPRVAIVPTGDELREIDEPLGPGQIPNSNSAMLAAQVRQTGCEPMRMAAAKDDADSLTGALCAAAEAADLLLTCGGVSVGDFDLVREVLGDRGQMDFWKVALKPGKPLAFGRVEGRPLIGLPGNPVSAFVCFELFARPALRRLGGYADCSRPQGLARLSRPAPSNANRRELLRGVIERRDDGMWCKPLTKQGSGQHSSLLGVDCLIDIPPGSGNVAEGDNVRVWLLD